MRSPDAATTRSSPLDSSCRSQSEVIGFVLVFAAVLAAIGGVSLLGLNALEDMRETTTADNGEFAMQAVAADMEALYYGTATSRTTELTLDSASLQTGDATTITVTNLDTSTQLLQESFVPLVYASDGGDIVYENSVVIREQREGAVALSEPLMSDSSDGTVIPVVDTDAAAGSASGSVQLYARVSGTDHVVHASGSTTVEVEVDTSSTQRADVWLRLLEHRLDSPTCSQSGTVVSCEFATDRLVVSVATLDVEFR
jgi:hypothetical protein